MKASDHMPSRPKTSCTNGGIHTCRGKGNSPLQPIATLLGATLIGMTAGAQAPFLQASGSFRKVHLLSVDYQAQARSHATHE